MARATEPDPKPGPEAQKPAAKKPAAKKPAMPSLGDPDLIE